jgi:hypothetical protein
MGSVQALYRHPVKGFTPERLERTHLSTGEGIAWDRAFAIEDGPSGFDPAAPAFVSKMRFTVLAKMPMLARLQTRFDDATGQFSVESEAGAFSACLFDAAGRHAFAAWLQDVLGAEAAGALRVLPAPGAHRFFDHPQGDVSLINLASVRDLAQRLGRPIDPLRFRANIYVEGWPPWAEDEAKAVALGAASADVFKPIVRCAATHVDLERGVRDIDLVGELHRLFGRTTCGVYLHVTDGAVVSQGDRALCR